MNFFSKNSSKARQQTNPLGAIVELIPYTDSIVDPKLLDSINLEFVKIYGKFISASAIMVLLIELEKAGVVTLTCFEYPSTLGQLFIIKRNT